MRPSISRHIVFTAYEGVSLLDLSGPLEAFRVAADFALKDRRLSYECAWRKGDCCPNHGDMRIRIPRGLENKMRVIAQEEGLTIEDYFERLISADERGE